MGANAVTTVYDFTAGQVLTAVQMDNVNCGIPVFATTTTRDAAFGGTGEKTLAEGQYAYIEADNSTQYYDGSAWKTIVLPWTSFTPTWASGFTVGNATQTWAYQIVNDLVVIEGRTALGSTSAVTGVPTLTLPINRNLATVMSIGTGTLQDAGTATYQAYPISTDATNCLFFAVAVGGTYASEGSTSATVPFTWTTNDAIGATLIYRQA
jgi:hypothetical protein